MSTKKKKVKLHQPTYREDLCQLLNSIESGDEPYVECRPRTSSKESDWVEVEGDHLWNTEKFNYREGDPPPIRMGYGEGHGDVISNEGSISAEEAKKLVKLARAAWKSKKKEIKPDPIKLQEYEVVIHKTGIAVGCESFTRKQVEDFAKKQGW